MLVACLLAVLGIEAPAYAVTPGSVTPIINNVPGNASFSVHANATGWARGTIQVSVDLYVGPSQTGPWTHIGGIDNSCANSTSCSTSSGFHGPLSGTCAETALATRRSDTLAVLEVLPRTTGRRLLSTSTGRCPPELRPVEEAAKPLLLPPLLRFPSSAPSCMKPSDQAVSGAPDLYVIPGARALTETPLQPNSVWLCELENVVYGVMTSPVFSSGGMAPSDLQRHAVLGAVQRCYVSEEFVRLMGSGPFDIAKIFDDLATVSFGSTTVKVEGNFVKGCTIDYGGLAFVGGHDPILWPFLIARRAELGEDWPTLSCA